MLKGIYIALKNIYAKVNLFDGDDAVSVACT